MSLIDLHGPIWTLFPIVAIFFIPNWYVGQKDKFILVDLRGKIFLILKVLAFFGIVLFLSGVISLGLALLIAAPLYDYVVWSLLYKRFIRVHRREPRNMMLNMDTDRSNDPDRFYAFAVVFSTVFPSLIIPVLVDRLMPITLWH